MLVINNETFYFTYSPLVAITTFSTCYGEGPILLSTDYYFGKKIYYTQCGLPNHGSQLNPQPVTPVMGVTGKYYGCQRASTSRSIHGACHMLCQ